MIIFATSCAVPSDTSTQPDTKTSSETTALSTADSIVAETTTGTVSSTSRKNTGSAKTSNPTTSTPVLTTTSRTTTTPKEQNTDGYSTIFYENGGFFDDFIGGVNPALWYIGMAQWGGTGVNGGVIPENVSFTKDGILILTGNGDYYEGPIRGIDSNRLRKSNGKRTGAAIITNRPLGAGSYEVRMKVHPRLGTCSAMWTYFSDGVRNHEIDIEIPGNKYTFNYTLFSNWLTDRDGTSIGKIPSSPNNDGQWHTYRFDWHTNPKQVVYYVDGVRQFSDSNKVPTVNGYFWIGVWFPKDWCGNPNFDTDYMLIDWVKYTPFDESGGEENKHIFNQQAPLSAYPRSPVSLPVSNYISNADFEVDSQAWEITGGAEIKEGKGLSASRASMVSAGSMSQIVSSINQGLTYTLKASAFIQGGGTAVVKVECLDRSGKVLEGGEAQMNFSTERFEEKTLKFQTVSHTENVRITLMKIGGGVAYFDDLYMSIS